MSTIKPTFHHFNLKTTRLQEMIDWYGAVVGAEVTFQDDMGAWLTNDAANHRIALLAFPGFVDDPDKETRTGMHHSAFEYGGFEELNDSYLRLREAGHRARHLPRPRDDALLLLQGPRRQPRRAADRRVRRLGRVEGVDADEPGLPREPDRRVRRPGARSPTPPRPGDAFEEIHRRAMAGRARAREPPVEIPREA